ncbi:MAG: GNAT family N-acetyltransferase [Alphaproteobacteria bacterium GM7ARS4]|nr:GNAT family N-acetyltransferase [Alphaproteobacteria bacterium GM7ARS4]
MPPSSYSIKHFDSITKIPRTLWTSCQGHGFTSYPFLAAMEESGATHKETGWTPMPSLLYAHKTHQDTSQADKGVETLKAAVPLYSKSHSYGEFVFDHAWAHAAHNAHIPYYPKALIAAPFSPVNGPRILPSTACHAHDMRALFQTLIESITHHGLSSLHVTFLPRDQAREAEQAGCLTRYGIQYHWHNDSYASFDDFLNHMPSRKRKNIKKERHRLYQHDAHGLEIGMEHASQLSDDDWHRFYTLYIDTIERHHSYAYLPPSFFPLLAQKMPDHILVATARLEKRGALQAAALHIKDDHTLYGRYWGATRPCRGLHFELCYYQAIIYAIAHHIHTIEAGAQGIHKLLRGYQPHITYSSHYIVHPQLRQAVERFLQQERQDITQHYEALKQYAHRLTP